MADVFTPELTFGPASSGMMQPTAPGLSYRTILLGETTPVNPYAAYALALDFDDPQYWVGGTEYSPETALPGYSFTRSGSQGAVDASGAVAYFAANVPAINSAGYHAYGALTNGLVRSQEFNNASWLLGQLTVTADTTVAPDGTTTSDTLAEDTTTDAHFIYQVSALAGGVNTFSVFVKQGTQRYVSLRMQTAGGMAWLTCDLQTGAVAINAAAAAGYAVACANGFYRVVLVATASAAECVIALSDVATAPGTGNAIGNSYLGASKTVFVQQAQVLSGNFPDGGPIIVTAGATASIGASLLLTTANTITTDLDHIIVAVVDFSAPQDGGQANVVWSFGGAGDVFLRRTSGDGFDVGVVAAAASIPDRGAILFRRRAGQNSIAVRTGGVTTVGVESAVAWTARNSTLAIGAYQGGGFETDGEIELLTIQSGTFNDAAVISELLAVMP